MRDQPSMWLSMRARLRFTLKSVRRAKTVPASRREVSQHGRRSRASSGTSMAIRSTSAGRRCAALTAVVHFPLCSVTRLQFRAWARSAASARYAGRRAVGTMIALTP